MFPGLGNHFLESYQNSRDKHHTVFAKGKFLDIVIESNSKDAVIT